MTTEHKPTSVPQSCRHCGRLDGLVEVVNWEREHFMVCKDGVRCLRRSMAAEGIKLLPHPKNPEVLRGL